MKVEPRVLDLLLVLISHRDRVVTKSELLQQVWRGVAVSPSVLHRSVCVARQTLGDSSAIRTVHARGYQWAGPTGQEEGAFKTGVGEANGVAPQPRNERDTLSPNTRPATPLGTDPF